MIKNFRIGGIGFGGARSSSSTIIKNNATPESPVPDYVSEYREAVYSLSGGGLTLEYTVPFIKNIGVSVGAIIGRGSLNIQLYKNLGSYDWQYFWAQADNSSSSTFSSTLKNNFWIFTPTLNVDIPAFHLLLFRLGAGYQFTFGDAWTYDNGKDIFNVPSNISGNCFFIQTGIFVGIFSF